MNAIHVHRDNERVSFLRSLNILDTEADIAFDRITEAASTITHAPIALVSLVDSARQWFKSKVGINISETSRDQAFCSHVIAKKDDKIFVVNDALEDERFKHSSLVLGDPYIRFYAGVPLALDAGNGLRFKIGTLCIVDQKPRKLENHHCLVMEALAQLVVTEIDKLRFTPWPQSVRASESAPSEDILYAWERYDWNNAAHYNEQTSADCACEAEVLRRHVLHRHQPSQLRIQPVARRCDLGAPMRGAARRSVRGRTARSRLRAARRYGSGTSYDGDSDGARCESDTGIMD